jgi:hypothetical protein
MLGPGYKPEEQKSSISLDNALMVSEQCPGF